MRRWAVMLVHEADLRIGRCPRQKTTSASHSCALVQTRGMKRTARNLAYLASAALVVTGIVGLVYLANVWIERGYLEDAGVGYVTDFEEFVFWMMVAFIALPLVFVTVEAIVRKRAPVVPANELPASAREGTE